MGPAHQGLVVRGVRGERQALLWWQVVLGLVEGELQQAAQ